MSVDRSAPAAARPGSAVSIAVVGGAGQMGAWLVRFWQARGCNVRMSDRGTSYSNRDVAGWADVTFVAVPLRSTAAVLEDLRHSVRSDGALVSIASLMQPSVEAMAGLAAEGICAHPVFGPTVASLAGLPLVIAANRPGKWADWLTGQFLAAGMHVLRCSAAEHDTRMSFVQALLHSLYVALAGAFAEGSLPVPAALPWASPTLRLQFGLLARILGQDPELYADLVVGNEVAPDALDALIRRLQILADFARTGDRQGFVGAFEASRDSFGDTLSALAGDAEEALARAHKRVSEPAHQPQESSRAGARGLPEGISRTYLLLGLLVVAAALYRVVLLARYYVIPDADQTVLGLMARHILQGERPIFYWGQPYTGAGEAYLTAILFKLFGQSDLLLHVVPFAASLLFIGAVSLLATRLYGPGVAVLCAVFLAFGPILLIEWGFWAGSGYIEMMALGTTALLLALPPVRGTTGASWVRVPACFLLLGLALWSQPTALFYAPAIAMVLAPRITAVLRSPARWPSSLVLCVLSVAMLAAGAAPLVIFNLQHSGETLSFLLQRGTGSTLSPLTVLARALLWAGPVLTGLLPPTTDRQYLYSFMLAHWSLYAGGLIVTLTVGTWLPLAWRSVITHPDGADPAASLGSLALLSLCAFLLLGFLSSSWGAAQWSESQPRYLLPLYTALPLFIRAALPVHLGRHGLALSAALVMLAVAGNIYVNAITFSRQDLAPLALRLEQRGITAVYGDYWTVYPLMLESDERLTGVAVNDDLSQGYNRRLSYLRTAAQASHFAWVVATGSARQRSVEGCLAKRGSSYSTFTWENQTIYDAPSNRAFPYWNGGACKP